MELLDSLREFYFSLEEKYYHFMDWLEDKKIPSYKFVDFFENRKIPSFPVFVALILILLILIVYFLFFLLTPKASPASLDIIVMQEGGKPLVNATITLIHNGETSSSVTGSTGVTSFSGLAPDTEVRYTIEKEGYETIQRTVPVISGTKVTESIELSEIQDSTITKTILFYEAGTGLSKKYTKEFTARFECTNLNVDFDIRREVFGGEITLEDIPSTCTKILIKDLPALLETDDDILLSEQIPKIEIKQLSTASGRIEVRVISKETREEIAGVPVKIISTNGTLNESDDFAVPGAASSTGSFGIAVFEEVPVGEYYAISIDDGRFGQGKSVTGTLTQGRILNFALEVGNASLESIDIKLTDEFGLPVKNAKSTLRRGNITLKTEHSNESGIVNFSVERGAYIFTIDDDRYFIFHTEVATNNEPYEFTLKQATTSNAGKIKIKVVDNSETPIEGVPVVLKISNTQTPIGNARYSGSDGYVEFENLEAGTYYAVAQNPGFLDNEPTPTRNITVEARTVSVETLIVVLGQGTIVISVQDEAGALIQGANVRAINLSTGNEFESQLTNSRGEATFNVRIDRTPYFIVEADEYLNYTTSGIRVAPNIQTNKTVQLRKAVSQVRAELVSVSFGGGEAFNSLAPGQEYTALLRLLIPSGRNFSNFGMFVRTGEFRGEQTFNVAGDNIFINNVRGSFETQKRGLTFSPPNGYVIDLAPANINGYEDAKWTDIVFKPNSALSESGVFEIEVDFFVRELTPEGAILPLSYRGYAQNGATFTTDPATTDILDKSDLQFAATKDLFFTAGGLEICESGFCRQLQVQEVGGTYKANVFEVLQINQDSEYKFFFTFNKDIPGTLENVNLEITAGSGIEIETLEYTLPNTQKEIVDNPKRKNIIPLTTFSQGATVFGNFTFIPEKDSTTDITFTFTSQGNEIYSKKISLDVLSSRQANMEVLPIEFAPLIDNKAIVRIFEYFEEDEEEETISDFTVTVLLNGNVIAFGETDSDGLFAFELEAPAEGSELVIKAKKTGYRRMEVTKVIDSTILNVIPPVLKADYLIDNEEDILIEFLAINYLPIDLTIEKIEVHADTENYFIFSELNQYEGLVLENGFEQQFVFKGNLTPVGRQITQTTLKDLEAIITLTNEDKTASWDNAIPLRSRVLLGSELEELDCLVLDKIEWSVSTESESKTADITLTNTCRTLDGFSSLTRLVADLDLPDISPGTFKLESIDLGLSSTELTDEELVLADLLRKQEKIKLSLTFVPSQDIKSFEGTALLTFSATHTSVSGQEIPVSQYLINININKLLECLNVVNDRDIELRTCNNNTGYAFFENQFTPFSQQAFFTPTVNPNSPFNDPTVEVPNQSFSEPTFPFSPIDRPLQTTQFTESASANFSCEESGSFIIENNCSENVEVTLDTHPAVNVDESRFDILSRESRSVIVSPGIRTGVYPIDIRARLKTSSGEYRKIDTVNVRILSLEDIEENCKPIISPTNFSVPFTGYSQTAGQIFNNCYDLGYRLAPINEADFICYTIDSSGRTLGACPLIESVFSDTPRVIKKSENESVEVLNFGLKYNTDVAKQWPGFVEGTPEEQLGNLRFSVGRLFASVESPGTVNIRFTTPFSSGDKTVSRNVTFEDPLQWIGAVSVIMKRGSPHLEPAQCIRPESFDITQVVGELKDEDFVNNRFEFKPNPPKHEYVMPMPVNNEDVESGLYCGEADSIESVKIRSFTDPDSRVKVEFRLAHAGHHVIATVDRSNMLTECAEVEFENTISARRVFQKQGVQEVKMPVKVRVLNKGVEQFTSGCETRFINEKATGTLQDLAVCTETGENFYTQLGFDRLRISWNSVEFDDRTCSPRSEGGEGIFCDATQFSLALASKVRNIDRGVVDLTEEYNSGLQSSILASLRSIPGMIKELEKPGNLFRLSKKQIIVKDLLSFQTNKLFFLQETEFGPRVLEPQRKVCNVAGVLENLNNIANELEEITSKSKKETLRNAVNRTNEQLQLCYSGNGLTTENLLVLLDETVDSDMRTGESAKPWEGLVNKTGLFSLEPTVIEHEAQVSSYIMTFNEFKRLELDLIRQGDKKDEANVTINFTGKSVTAKKLEWVSFLDKFKRHSTFLVGIRNSPSLTDELKEYIRINATDLVDGQDVSSTESAGQAYLIADNYSTQFSNDFKRVYGSLPGFDNKKFKFVLHKRYEDGEFLEPLSSTVVQAGLYAYRIETGLHTDFGLPFFGRPDEFAEVDEFIVKIAPIRGLGQINPGYTKNVFFNMPFDAPLMGADTKNYGTGFKNTPARGLHYFANSPANISTVRQSPSKFMELYIDTRQGMSDTRQGNLMDISLSKKRLIFTPSIPKAINVSWDTETNNEIYYKLNPEKYERLSSVITWKSFNETKTSDFLDNFSPASFCEGWNSSRELLRARFEPGQWKSIIYVPEAVLNLNLELFCAKEFTSISVTSLDGSVLETTRTKGLAGGALSLTENRFPINSFREILDQVKAGNVCIKNASATTALFKWNPGGIFGETLVFTDDTFFPNAPTDEIFSGETVNEVAATVEPSPTKEPEIGDAG